MGGSRVREGRRQRERQRLDKALPDPTLSSLADPVADPVVALALTPCRGSFRVRVSASCRAMVLVVQGFPTKLSALQVRRDGTRSLARARPVLISQHEGAVRAGSSLSGRGRTRSCRGTSSRCHRRRTPSAPAVLPASAGDGEGGCQRGWRRRCSRSHGCCTCRCGRAWACASTSPPQSCSSAFAACARPRRATWSGCSGRSPPSPRPRRPRSVRCAGKGAHTGRGEADTDLTPHRRHRSGRRRRRGRRGRRRRRGGRQQRQRQRRGRRGGRRVPGPGGHQTPSTHGEQQLVARRPPSGVDRLGCGGV